MRDTSLRQNLRESFTLLVVLGLLAASLSLNVVLGWKTKGVPTRREGLRSGVLLSGVTASDLAGTRVAFDFVNRTNRTLLYVFSPGCTWCNRNEDNIAAVSRSAAPHFRVIGLSITSDGLQQYVSRVKPPFPVYSLIREGNAISADLKVTPQTVVIGTDGKVQRTWVGAFTGSTGGDIERFFSIKLPGLQPI